MTRFRRMGLISLVATGLFGSAWISSDAFAAGKPAPAKTAKSLPPLPAVREPIRLTPEGLRLGMQVPEVIDFYNKVIDQDYVAIYKATPVGPRMKEVDAALSDEKGAFARSEVVFGDIPTGIDNTALKGEYNYKNNETMMSLIRQGVTRYFFFINKRLWKVYDALPLKKEGDLGPTYQQAIAVLTKRYGVAGRVLPEDAEHGRSATEVDWGDATTHVRAIDRSYENLVGLVIQDRSLDDRHAALRALAMKSDEGGIDPTIAAITRGGPAVDSNASAADAYTGRAHATPPASPPAGPPPAPKKK